MPHGSVDRNINSVDELLSVRAQIFVNRTLTRRAISGSVQMREGGERHEDADGAMTGEDERGA